MIPYGAFTEAEKNAFVRHLMKCDTYLEWGAGNSTLMALKLNVRRVVSVEGNLQFLTDWVRSQPQVAQAESRKRLRVIYANTGSAGPYTDPDVSWTLAGMEYSMPKIRSTPDFALVDGRFRVACALTAALLGVKRVAVHDFESRPHYQPMLEFFDVECMADSMAILKLKRGLKKEAVVARRALFFKDPR